MNEEIINVWWFALKPPTLFHIHNLSATIYICITLLYCFGIMLFNNSFSFLGDFCTDVIMKWNDVTDISKYLI